NITLTTSLGSRAHLPRRILLSPSCSSRSVATGPFPPLLARTLFEPCGSATPSDRLHNAKFGPFHWRMPTDGRVPRACPWTTSAAGPSAPTLLPDRLGPHNTHTAPQLAPRSSSLSCNVPLLWHRTCAALPRSCPPAALCSSLPQHCHSAWLHHHKKRCHQADDLQIANFGQKHIPVGWLQPGLHTTRNTHDFNAFFIPSLLHCSYLSLHWMAIYYPLLSLNQQDRAPIRSC